MDGSKRNDHPEPLRFTSNYTEASPPESFQRSGYIQSIRGNDAYHSPQIIQARPNRDLFGPSLPLPTIYSKNPVLQLRLTQANRGRQLKPSKIFVAEHVKESEVPAFKTYIPATAIYLPTVQTGTSAGAFTGITLSELIKRNTFSNHRRVSRQEVVSPSRSTTPLVYKRQRVDGKIVTVPNPPVQTSQRCPAAQEEDHDESKAEFKNRLTHAFEQMMFVSGETAEASAETTWMIEEIVREQVVEMLKEATILANRRGSKSIAIVDLIFQIRHNTAKVSRLKTFLSWKDVRKNVKDSDDKAGGADADALDLDDAAVPGANPSAPQKSSTNKKAKLILPWEVQSFYSEQVPEREDEEDEEEEEQNEATLARLASADERTRNMTRVEYVHWSDCRQASFTFRKGKRFREWAGFGTIVDSKPNDDVVDILGFLTFEIVQTLTEEALKVKAAEDLANKKANGGRGDIEATKKRKREGCTLFEMPEEGRTPVEPKHVREAFRRLQIIPPRYKAMRQGYAGIRTPLRMI